MEITQEDREAAEALYPAFLASLKGEEGAQSVAAVIAAHRIASEQAVLAKLRERFEELCEKGDRSSNYIGKYDVAALIDALEQKP